MDAKKRIQRACKKTENPAKKAKRQKISMVFCVRGRESHFTIATIPRIAMFTKKVKSVDRNRVKMKKKIEMEVCL